MTNPTRRRKQPGDGVAAVKPPKAKVPAKKSSTTTFEGTGWCSSCLQVLMYIGLVIIVPPLLNHAALQREFAVLKEEGLFYDIGWNQKIYVKCSGKGGPTVVLEAPAGRTSDVWYNIQPALSQYTRVCSYDRAGLGFSDPSPKNLSNEDVKRRGEVSTVERMADDLHQVLTVSSSQPSPFIMVGAEMGALITRFYTQMHHNDVSDLVLIDPMVEVIFEEEKGIWQQFWFQHIIPSIQMLQFCSAIGLTRLGLILGLVQQPIREQNISNSTFLRQKHLMCSPSHQSAAVDEHYFINDSIAQVKTAFKVKPFPETINVNIIKGNYHDESLPSILNEAWSSSVDYLTEFIHRKARVTTINGSDGRVFYTHPEPIIQLIKKLITKSKDKVTKNSQGSSDS